MMEVGGIGECMYNENGSLIINAYHNVQDIYNLVCICNCKYLSVGLTC